MNHNINLKIDVIVGLSGSGKSFLGNKIAKETNGLFIDDISLKGLEVLNNVEANHLIIADVYLCRLKDRLKAFDFFWNKFLYTNPKWTFFENDPEKCLNNIRFRNDGRKVEELIKTLTKEYYLPKGIKTIPIWQNS